LMYGPKRRRVGRKSPTWVKLIRRVRLVAFAESGNKSVATVLGLAASNTKASHSKP
jgi:hypothetical protein